MFSWKLEVELAPEEKQTIRGRIFRFFDEAASSPFAKVVHQIYILINIILILIFFITVLRAVLYDGGFHVRCRLCAGDGSFVFG